MKIYRGDRIKEIAVVQVDDGKTNRDLASPDTRAFSWGTKTHETAATALAILKDLLGDDAEALRLHRRFMWRSLVGINPAMPFMMTEAAIHATLVAIDVVEQETAPLRSQNPPAPIAIEGGIGPGGSPITWDSGKLKPNAPLKE